jgi:hypothetical protein
MTTGIDERGERLGSVNRRLPHPEEPIFDQGLAFDLETRPRTIRREFRGRRAA